MKGVQIYLHDFFRVDLTWLKWARSRVDAGFLSFDDDDEADDDADGDNDDVVVADGCLSS